MNLFHKFLDWQWKSAETLLGTLRVLTYLLVLAGVFYFKDSRAADLPNPVLPISEPVTVTITLPPQFDSEYENEWRSLENKLSNSTEKATVILRNAGYGGQVMLASRFQDAMVQARAKETTIVMRIVSTAASAHAMLACYADKVEMKVGSALMFHQGAIGISHLFGYIYERSYTLTPFETIGIREQFNQCIRAKILTTEDVNKIYQGYSLSIVQVSPTQQIKLFEVEDAIGVDYWIQWLEMLSYLCWAVCLIALIKRV